MYNEEANSITGCLLWTIDMLNSSRRRQQDVVNVCSTYSRINSFCKWLEDTIAIGNYFFFYNIILLKENFLQIIPIYSLVDRTVYLDKAAQCTSMGQVKTSK